MKERHFYAFLSRMKYINRWGLMRNTRTENIQEHSYEVAVLAHALALISNRYFGGSYDPGKTCLYALFHDANEIITGDLPTPVKYFNPEIKESYGRLEELSKERLLDMLPEEFRPDYRPLLFYEREAPAYIALVKAADKLSAYIKCIEEVKAGNSEFKKARAATKSAVEEMELPAAQYFMENFIEAYGLSLDELD